MFDVAKAVESVSEFGTTIVDKIWVDADVESKRKAELTVLQMTQNFELMIKQIEVNMKEAQHASVFVSGWRPYIGWVCGMALSYAALVEPFARFIAVVAFDYTGEFPVIDTDLTLQILLGMLGLAGYRTYEKSKGVERK